MESPQSVVSQSNGCSLSNGSESITKKPSESFVGVLEVFVHQARDIHNICIYHKQDVYAKLCLTSDPSYSVSTKIINGGGRNPVFDDSLELNVKTVDCSLKCEVYMMSRVKNYLEDQLLGFAMVPLSEVIVRKGKLEREFSLSSSDLFHSPAGFVRLSLSYSGDSPDVMPISKLPAADASKSSEEMETIPNEMDQIEFMDPNIVSENNLMVSEYFGISCSDKVESENGDSETYNGKSAEVEEAVDSSASNVSTGSFPSPSPSMAVSSGSSDAPNDESLSEAKKEELKNSPSGKIEEDVGNSGVIEKIEREEKVVQQEIVDMYMRSMQEFTESLAKMKLPLEVNSLTETEKSSSSSQMPKSAGSRVFYGSRAFF